MDIQSCFSWASQQWELRSNHKTQTASMKYTFRKACDNNPREQRGPEPVASSLQNHGSSRRTEFSDFSMETKFNFDLKLWIISVELFKTKILLDSNLVSDTVISKWNVPVLGLFDLRSSFWMIKSISLLLGSDKKVGDDLLDKNLKFIIAVVFTL